jgi:hypothetical protein
MTYLPGIHQPIPSSPVYPSTVGGSLTPSEYPMVYTTDGPLPTANGIGFSSDNLTLMPEAVQSGTFDCGTFSTPA